MVLFQLRWLAELRIRIGHFAFLGAFLLVRSGEGAMWWWEGMGREGYMKRTVSASHASYFPILV